MNARLVTIQIIRKPRRSASMPRNAFPDQCFVCGLYGTAFYVAFGSTRRTQRPCTPADPANTPDLVKRSLAKAGSR